MTRLELLTWARFGAWLVIGLVIYFAYGMRHSRVRASTGRFDRQSSSAVNRS
jgi:basic amino acid/polyamine antiporter, APA family